MKVLGIDPGYGRCGIAVVERIGSKESLVFSDCIETSADLPFAQRLKAVADRVIDAIRVYGPEAIAIEEVYFSKNQKTAFHVAEVRGMLLYLAVNANLPVFEYNPLSIKIAITGYGRSNKEQVTAMIERIVRPNKKIRIDDEYDAIAVGITHLASAKSHINTRN